MRGFLLTTLLALSGIFPTSAIAQQGSGRRISVPQSYLSAPTPVGRKSAQAPSKLSTKLREIRDAVNTRGPSWKNAVDTAGLLFRGSQDIRLEIRFDPSLQPDVHGRLQAAGATITSQNAPGLLEAFVPVGSLAELAADNAVYFVRPARLVIPLEGNSTTQGVAVSNASVAHSFGIDGSGVTIAVIDVFKDSLVAPLQASGDWPPSSRLDTVDVDGGGFGSLGIEHGMATLEIAYDMAPGASFIAYETATQGDWYAAIIAAVAAGADVISVSLGTTLDGIGDGSAMPGSIAEAAGIAKAAGVLVVNAAGNESLDHWGGLYTNSTLVNNTHDWDGAGEVGNLNIHPFCQQAGTVLGGDLSWDDWTNVDHDYDLYLFEHDGLSWVQRAVSDDFQNGFPGQTPTESIVYTAETTFGTPICGAGFGLFGWMVMRYNAPTDRNLQFFASTFLGLPVPERSLLFPADSPDVISVAAVDVTYLDQEFYSSEGPILAPGGGIPSDSTLGFKPDVSGFANVDTETYGPNLFNGTSSATPHVAGLAALMLSQNHAQTVEELMARVRANAAANDLGPVGFDPNYGFGKAAWVGDTLRFVGKVFLEGPFEADFMSTSALFQASLPLSQPYADPLFDGTEIEFDSTVSVVGFPPGTVDWIVVDLRETVGGSAIGRQPAFVLSDGEVVGVDGDTLTFPGVPIDSFFVVVGHRNHQRIMSSAKVAFDAQGVGSWDFTSSMASAYASGSSPMKELGSGSFGMFAGNGVPDAVTTASDFNVWLIGTKAAASGYDQTDYNLDGQVTTADFNLWLGNTKFGAASQVP